MGVFNRIRQKGIAALLVVIMVLIVITLVTLYSSQVVVTDSQSFGNTQGNVVSLNAAQSGFDYALGYLNASTSSQNAVVATNLGNCASAATTYTLPSPGALPDGSTYTMQYGCVAAGNANLLSITATGTSTIEPSTRTLQARVMNTSSTNVALISVGTAALAGGTVANNLSGAKISADSGGSITSPANATCNGTGSCILASDPNLTGQTAAQMQTTYAGGLLTSFAAAADINLSCAANKTFTNATTLSTCTVIAGTGASTLSGTTGKTIYINMNGFSLTLNSPVGNTFTLGTLASPVNLIVVGASSVTIQNSQNCTLVLCNNGTTTIDGGVYVDAPLTIKTNETGLLPLSPPDGQTTINGLVFTSSSLATLQNININGAAVAGSTASVSGSSVILLNSTSKAYVTAASTTGYGIVSGSWRDF